MGNGAERGLEPGSCAILVTPQWWGPSGECQGARSSRPGSGPRALDMSARIGMSARDWKEAADEYATALGGVVPPTVPYHTAWDIDAAVTAGPVTGGIVSPGRPIRDLLPAFTAFRRRFFLDPAHAWAYQREEELREERKAREAEHELAVAEWPFTFPTYRRDP